MPGNIVYQGALTREDTGLTDYYTGLSQSIWKLRYGNHKQNFKIDTQFHRTATSIQAYLDAERPTCEILY